MTAFDLYGFQNSKLEVTKLLLESALNVAFSTHESAYRGGKYFRQGNLIEEHFELLRNIDLFDGRPSEPDFKDYPVLLYVNRTSRSDFLQNLFKEKIPSSVLLRHELII